MPLSDEDVQLGRVVSDRPEEGALAALLADGTVQPLVIYDRATDTTTVHGLAGGGGGGGGTEAGGARPGEVGVVAPQYAVGDVRRYGAVPYAVNPLADCTAAIRNADTSARALGVAVRFPAGAWRVTGTLQMTTPWRGEGRFLSEILTEVNDGSDTIQVNDRDNWAIEQMRVRGNIVPGMRPNTTGLGTLPMADGNGASRWVMRSFEVTGCAVGMRVHGWIADASDAWATYCDVGFFGKEVNGGRLTLFVEVCGEGFRFDWCDGLDLTLVCEGCTVRGGRLTRCHGMAIDGCYFEQNTGPHLLIGVAEGAESPADVRCTDLTLSAGKFAGAQARAYAITADHVDGLTIQHPQLAMGANYTNVLVTPNARRVKFEGKPDFGWVHDDAGLMVPPWNYCPNPTFRYWLRGFHSVTPTRATVAQETVTTRAGGSALRLTAAAGPGFNYVSIRLPDAVRDALRGRTVRLLVPLYVPQHGVFAQPMPPGLSPMRPAVGLSDGVTTTMGPNQFHHAGHWNLMDVVATVAGGATQLAVAVYLNHSATAAAGDEYVIVGGICIADETVDLDELRAGRWVPHPLAGHGLGPNWVGYGTAAPTSATLTHAVGDRVWNTAPTAGSASYWECVEAGSPGTWAARGVQGLTRPTAGAPRVDTSFNVLKGVTEDVIRLAGPATFDKTVTLLPAGAVAGDRVTLYRTDPSAFRWRVQQSVGGVMTTVVDLPGSSVAWAELTFDGALWFLSGYAQAQRKRVAAARTADTSFNLQKGVTEDVVRIAGPLTANRTVTLFSAGALAGDEIEVVRTDTSFYSVTVQRQNGSVVRVLPNGVQSWARFVFDGSSWFLSAYGQL